MADETQPAPESKPKDDRASAIKAFYDCKTDDERKAMAVQYPWLKEVFSAAYF